MTKTKEAVKPGDNGNLDADAAREVLLAERDERVEACRAELDALMKRHNCQLDVAVVLRANSVQPQIQIVAL